MGLEIAEVSIVAVLLLIKHCEPAVEPGVVNGGEGHAEQILQGAGGIPAFGDLQLALVAAEARDRQDAGDLFPRHGLSPRVDDPAQQGVQPDPPPQGQGEIHLAEVAHPFDPKTAHIDLGPPGRWRRGRHGVPQLALHSWRGPLAVRMVRLFKSAMLAPKCSTWFASFDLHLHLHLPFGTQRRGFE